MRLNRSHTQGIWWKPTPKYSIITNCLNQWKRDSLKSRGKSCITYRGTKIEWQQISLQKQHEWEDTGSTSSKNWGGNWQHSILYPAKIYFKNENKIDFLRHTKFERICHQ